MPAYYNEHDPKAAAWLRELIKAGHIAPGEVDERSIEDVIPNELAGFDQCHFFAGIGVWSYALRLSGWPDDRPVWTGSCPCQPFSSAGKGEGTADERHLWLALHFLIEQRRPAVFFGEQVASKDGLAWLDIVHSDLAAAGYAIGAADLCAAGVGAPHVRQRLWIVAKRLANADDARSQGRNGTDTDQSGRQEAPGHIGPLRPVGELADAAKPRRRSERTDCDAANRLQLLWTGQAQLGRRGTVVWPGPTNGHWRVADWLHCRDGRWRPVEPGTFPLAHGAPARVGRLRGYGNAIVAQAAQAFIECVMGDE